MTFYDMDYNNNTHYRQDYAIRLTDHFVSGLSFPTSTLSSISSSTDVILSSLSPTLYKDNDNSKLLWMLSQYNLFEMTTVSSNQGHLALIIGCGKFILHIELLLWIIFIVVTVTLLIVILVLIGVISYFLSKTYQNQDCGQR